MPVVSLRRRRAFSLLEVAAATALFAIVSIGVSLAVSSSLGSRASNAIEFRLRGELDQALVELSYTPFEELLNNEFTPPSPCAGSASQGTKGTSCFTVADKDFTASWSAVYAADVVEASTEAVAAVTLVASVELPDGSVVSRAKRITAPTPGFNGESLLRAQFSGAYDQLQGPVFLVQADSPSVVVGSSQVSSFGSALFRVPTDACTDLVPCRLALSPSNIWSSDGKLALSPSSSIGDDAKIVLSAGRVIQVGAEIFPVQEITVDLLARSDSGKEAPPTALSSICLWAAFNDGSANRLVPSCNDEAAGSVTFSTYAVDPAQPSLRARIPRDVEIRFYVDRPNGTCPDLGQMGAEAGSWAPSAVCTSWTWGVPLYLGVDGDEQSFSTPLRPTAGAKLTAVWTGPLARPAIGFGDRPLWVNPRSAGSCAAAASCTPSFTSAPEASICPNSLCLSARLPSLLAPSTGAVYAKQVSSSTTVFDLEVVDEYGDPVQVQLLTEPQSGSLEFDGTTLQAGDVIGTTPGPDAGSLELTFLESQPIDMVFFTLRLSNSVEGGIRDVDVALYRNARPWLFSTRQATVAQGESTTVSFTMTATDSTPADAETVSLSAPSGFTLPATATSDATGRITFTLAAGSLPPGSYSIQVQTPTLRSTTIPIVVEQTAGSLTVQAPDLAQGATATVSVSVKDVLGDPMEGALVSFATAASGAGFAPGVRTVPSGCSTDASGNCSVSLIAESAAPGGGYTLTARSDGKSASDGFNVASVPSRLSATSLILAQGSSASWVLTVKDASGGSLPGRTVSVSSAPSGVQLSPTSLTSSASGVVSFAVSVTEAAASGLASVSFTVDGVPVSASFTISQQVASLQVPASVDVQRGSSARVRIRVLDSADNPVSNVSLFFTPTSNIQVKSSPTDSDGFATATISVSSSATKGAASLAFSTVSTPQLNEVLSLSIAAEPRTISLSGYVPQGGRSALSLAVFDREGDPVPGASVVLSGLPSSINVSPRASTNLSGIASLPVLDTSATALGTYRATARVSLNDATQSFSVLVPVLSAASSFTAPAAVAAPTATATSATSASVAFSAPVNTGGASVSSYQVYVNGTLSSTVSSSPATVSGLSSATQYSIAVAACSSYGCSPMSASSTVLTFPSPPQVPSVSSSGTSGTLQVSWAQITPTPTALWVRTKRSDSVSWLTPRLVSSTALSHVLQGLSNGFPYDVALGVGNSSGVSWSSSASATPAAPPSTPTTFSVQVSGYVPELSWTTPTSDGGLTVSQIRIYRNKLILATIAGSATSYNDSGVTTGTHSYSVAACNEVGCSPTSSARAVSVTVPPSAPTAPTVSNETTTGFSVSWGSTISSTSYQLFIDATQLASTSATSYTVSNVSTGSAFSVQVKACNSGGCSGASTATTAYTRPSAPTNVLLAPLSGGLEVSWTDSVSPVVDGYEVWYRVAGSGPFLEWSPGVDDFSPTEVTGLVNGVSYEVYTKAVNPAGATASATSSATPMTTPSAPRTLSATPQSGQIQLSWLAPTSDGGSTITGYEVEASTDGGFFWFSVLSSTSTASSTTVTGLVNGTSYVFQVAAVNEMGTGTFSQQSSTVAPRTTPGSPLDVSPVSGNQQVALSWSEPLDDGGSAITDYQVEYSSNAGSTWSLFADGSSVLSSATVSGLTNGVGYVFRVAAVNAAGVGSYSISSDEAVPATVPAQMAAPTLGSISTSSITVSWSAPSNGGSAITGYTVYRNGLIAASLSAAASSYEDTGRTAATVYSYQVLATNDLGSSPISPATEARTLLVVSYDTQGGSSITTGSVSASGVLNDPGTPTRTGFTFTGWFTAASGGSALVFPYTHGQLSSFTLYAQWVQDE